jgi:hypothetical protein
MQYVLLIYAEEATSPPPQDEMDAVMAEWYQFDGAIRSTGIVLASDALQSTQTATSVVLKGDERVVTDGPFAETREALGGFYVIDVPDLDTAIDWAAKCPGAKYGTMEIRPILSMDDYVPPA